MPDEQEKKAARDLRGGPSAGPKPNTELLPMPSPRTPEGAPTAGEPDERGFLRKAGATAVRGVVKGLVTEPLDMIGDLGEAVGLGEGFNDVFDAPDNFIDSNIREAEGTGWQIAEGLIQFTAPFLATGGASAALKAGKVGQAVAGSRAAQKVATGAAKVKATGKAGKIGVEVAEFTAEASIRGAVVDFSSFDPAEGGLAEMVASTNVPVLKQLGNALSVHDTDNRLEARLKRMGEGAVLGVGADALIYGVRGAFRARMHGRMMKAAEDGLTHPSDAIKRDAKLAEAGKGSDPAPAQVTHMVDEKGNWRLVEQVPEGWRIGDEIHETLDDALEAGRKLGLREETLEESALRYKQAAEGDLRPLMEKKLVPEGTPGVKNKIGERRLRPDIIEEFSRKVDDVSKALDNADPKELPTAIEALVDDLHMNWKHYAGRQGDVSAPILLLNKLTKQGPKVSHATRKKRINTWLKNAEVSKTARAQVAVLQAFNAHDLAEQVLKSEAIFTGHARYTTDITRKLRTAVETGADEATVAGLRGEHKQAMLDMVRLQQELGDFVGDIARGLEVGRMRDEVKEMVQRGADQAEIDEFVKKAEKQKLVGEPFETMPYKDAEEWLSAMDDHDLQALAELIEVAGKAPNFAEIVKTARRVRGAEAGGRWDALMEWQTAGLLSGPRTWAKILVSNIAVGFNESVWAELAGSSMKGLSQADREAMRLSAMSNLYGLFAYAQDGFIAAKSAWKHNLPVADPYTVREVVKGKKGEVARTPFRIINFMDTYSKVVIAKQQARTAGIKKALAGGSTFDEAVEFGEKMATASIDKATGIILFEPGRKLGNKVAMMSPMNEGELAKGLQQLVQNNKVLQPFVKFIRPANALMGYAAELAPEAWGKKISHRVRMELTHGGPQARARLQAKRYTAYTSLMLMTGYFASGQVTAGGPQDPALREEWLRTHRPYSFKIGDRWAQYNWMPGVGLLASMWFGALETGTQSLDKATRAYTNEGVTDVLLKSTLSVTKAVMEQSYLQGIVSFVEMLGASEPREARKAFLNLTRGFMFAPLGQAMSFDPHYRDAESISEGLRASIPGLSRTVPPRYDAYGRPLESAYGNPAGAADPTKLSQPVEKPDDVTMALEELGAGFTSPPRNYQGKEHFDLHSSAWMGKNDKLTPWERFNQVLRNGDKKFGLKGLREQMSVVVQQEKFRAVTDEDYRNRALSSGRMTQLEYDTLKKSLHTALAKVRQAHYQAGYTILRKEYPKLDAELGQFIEAEARGSTRF
jgi:hypothetical protein